MYLKQSSGRWSWYRVGVVCRKEWSEIYHNRRVLLSTVLLPLILVVIGTSGQWGVSLMSSADFVNEPPPSLGVGRFEGLDVREQFQASLALQFLTLFLLIPLLIPISTATYSVVGEKRDRTLEPLLASPLRTEELLVGKAVASLTPGLLVAVTAYVVYAGLSSLVIDNARVFSYVLGPIPLLVMGVLAPLLGLLGVGLALLISSRSTDPRAAEQITSVLVLPLMGVFVAQVLGLVQIAPWSVVVSAVVLAVVDALLFVVATHVFKRGEILTRWR